MTGTFSTGFFQEDEWTADWIGRGKIDEVYSDVDAFAIRRVSEEIQSVTPEHRSPLFRNELDIWFPGPE